MTRAPLRCGPITLIKPVGSGGSGEVWLGRLDDDGSGAGAADNPVVLKRFSPSIAVDIDDILDSARLMRGLQLEHVGSVIDAGIDDEQAWVASPWIDGLDVQALLARTCDEGLDSDVAMLVAADILRGLSSLHACQLVHRDVSPANVMLDRVGRAVVVDLDFVCRSGTAATDTVPGTVAYMSPEHAQGLPVDARADLYVWAIVAYEILVGDAFYGDLGDVEILRLARTGGYRPRRFSVLSPALQKVLLKALAPDPTDRFTDAITVLSAFLAASSSSSSSSSRPALAVLVERHAGPAQQVPFEPSRRRAAPAQAAQIAADISGEVHGFDEPSLSVFRPRVGPGGRGVAAAVAVVVVLVLLAIVLFARTSTAAPIEITVHGAWAGSCSM